MKQQTLALDLATVPRWSLDLVMEAETPYDSGRALTAPAAAAHFFAEQIAGKPAEHMAAVFLDSQNRPIGWAILHIGAIDRTTAEPRPVLQTALLLNAKSIIVAHNHPSGTPRPSAEDIAYTKRLAAAGATVGIGVMDHLIIGHAGRYTSLREGGHFNG